MPKRLAILLLLLCPVLAHAKWTIEFTREAEFLMRYDGTTVLRAKYLAWGPNWQWAEVQTEIGRNLGDMWSITGKVSVLNLGMNGNIQRDGDKITFTWNLNATKASQNNVGGGIVYNLRFDKQVWGASMAEPKLLDNGWEWAPTGGDQTVRFTFEGTGAKPFFEKGKKDEVRVMFIPSNIALGERTVKMTVHLPPGAERTNGVAIRYGKGDQTWLANTVDWNASPVDLSYLNHKPAGKLGFVKADGERLVYGDGSEARFWGTNVVAYGIFDAKDDAIRAHAKRIAQLGYNLVRLHHHDSAEWSPSVFVKGAPDTRTLDAAMLDRIDYWVKCLKDEGVYVWLDLHVGRPFREGDGIDAFDELEPLRKTGRQAKGMNYVNRSVTDRMKEFATQYLTRVNKYTQTAYVDEPAVMGVLITNENDLTHHFGNNFLPERKRPSHQRAFEEKRDKIINTLGLDPEKAWRTWEAGPAKVVLNQIEYDWNVDFIKHLRSIGVKVPIATTNSFAGCGLFSLPALTAGDVVDVHAYGMAESLSSKPQYDDMSNHWLASAQVAGKPLVITEWNTEAPQRDRYTQPLLIAAHAAFQGWDAPMIYGYQQSPLTTPTKIDAFGSSNDPALIPLMPAAALMYRQGHVKPALQTVVFAPGEDLLMKNINAENSPALRTISERHRLMIGMPKTRLLPWLAGVEKGDAIDPMARAGGVGETSITSDTDELKRDWQQGLFTINTPKTQAAMGWMEGREIKLADVTFKITTPKATVAITALDDQPIATSKKMLLTVAAQTWIGGTPKVIRAEPVVGVVTFGAPVRVAPLSPDGRAGAMESASATVELNGRVATHWFLLTRD